MPKFEKGISGNPQGRPKGALSKRSQLGKLLESHAQTLIQKLVELAKQGDSTALKLCIERLIPKPKEEAIEFVLPEGNPRSFQTLLDWQDYVITAVSMGELTLQQGQQISSLFTAKAKTMEQLLIEERISEIERTLGIRKSLP